MRNTILFCSVFGLLTACGGGGDSPAATSANTNTSAVPTKMAALSAENYIGAAQDSLAARDSLESSSRLSGSSVGTKPAASAGNNQGSRKAQSENRFDPQLTQSKRLPCGSGYQGYSTASFNLANPYATTISPGDSVSMSFNCTATDQALTGVFEVIFESVVGDLSSVVYDIKAKVNINNLKFQEGDSSYIDNGNFAMALKSTAVNSRTINVFASDFSSTVTQTNTTVKRRLKDFTSNIVETPASLGYTSSTTLTGQLTSSRLADASVMVTTEQPLIEKSTDDAPSSGKLLLSGANGSKVRVTVQNASSVLLELDANGDGVYEQKTTKPWADIF
jgi:hypothetical protein